MGEAIEATNLSVRYNEHVVLEDITCAVPEGGFLAIVGPNGAGKSTFLKALLGLVKPCSGTLRLFEKPAEKVSPEWIGYVPQIKTLDRSFPALSVELVVSGMRRRWPGRIGKAERAAAMSFLEKVGAAQLAARPLSSLSGGELQRVYLAYSIARKPRMVIMDEPASGIDVVGQTNLYRILDDYRCEGNNTVAMVTHDWGIAFHHATRVLVVNRTMISFGAPQEALNDENLSRAYGHIGHAIFSGEK
jgi:zinc transport system ATP-binding protein